MRRTLFMALLAVWSLESRAGVVFSYPPSPAGGLVASSWVDPNGSDADMYAYDDFILASTQSITEVDWRGGYMYGAMYGGVFDFSITFYDSIAGGSQPLCTNPQLPEVYLAYYAVGGTAGEAPAGVFGGTTMYDYKFVLPTPFQASAGHKYWIRIEASQPTYPDWALAVGTGGDGQHFNFSTGAAMFLFYPNDTAFALVTASGAAAGAVPDGSTAGSVPLTLRKGSGSSLILSWGASCLATDTDYEIYEGTLGSFASHLPIACTTAGLTTATISPAAGGTYYLVASRNASAEGSLGRDSASIERPPGTAACFPRIIAACP